MKKESNKYFYLVFSILGLIGAFYYLPEDISRTEEETFRYVHQPRTRHGKESGHALIHIYVNWGKPGIVVFHGILTLGTAIGMGYFFYDEVSKEIKEKQKNLSAIMDMFEQNRSNTIWKIAKQVGISNYETLKYLEQLVAENKLEKMDNEEYRLREE